MYLTYCGKLCDGLNWSGLHHLYNLALFDASMSKGICALFWSLHPLLRDTYYSSFKLISWTIISLTLLILSPFLGNNWPLPPLSFFCRCLYQNNIIVHCVVSDFLYHILSKVYSTWFIFVTLVLIKERCKANARWILNKIII